MMEDTDGKNAMMNPSTFDEYEPPRVIRMGCFRATGMCSPGDYPGWTTDCLNGEGARGCAYGGRV